MTTQSLATGQPASPETRRLVRRRMVQVVASIVLQALILFLGSGRLGWRRAWLYLGCLIAVVVLTMLLVRDPELFAERAQMRKDAKGWDKLLAAFYALLGLALVTVAALDVRFAWAPALSRTTSLAGLALLLMGFGLGSWAMASNRFFSSLVRIQTERGHTVATGGPYRFVRHPGYVGFVLGNIAGALVLGSRWALVPALLTGVLLVVRTALEDRTLQRELPGYREYAASVRYRLVPGLW
jgi:protein-S-isoprenylcysteine O-methyltransferase Ste14